jgi:hypothetical protein
METSYLEAAKSESLRNEQGKVIRISPEKQAIMEEGIMAKLTEVSEVVGFSPDPKIIPDLLGKYREIVDRRQSAITRLNRRQSSLSAQAKVAVGAE